VIGRLIAAEFASLRRSPIVWLAMLLVVGGSAVARVMTWVARAVGRTELGALPFVRSNIGWSDAAVPLALIAYLVVTSYVFGRDFEDGNIELVLTAPVRRDIVVVARMLVIAGGVLALGMMGWVADTGMRSILATTPLDPGSATAATAALGSATAAIATLPLVAWAAIRFRGVLPALGLGIAMQVTAMVLGGIALVRSLPWLLVSTLAAGGGVSLLSAGLSALLFAGGLTAAVRELCAIDLYE
jgi:hypothetical protein